MPYLARPFYPTTGGVRYDIAPHRLPPPFSPRMQNIRIHDGTWNKRPALLDFNGTSALAGTITGIFEFRQENGLIDTVVFTGGAAIGNRRIYKSSGGAWANIADATLTDGAGTDDLEGSATDTWDATIAPSAASLTTLYASNGHSSTNKCEIVKWTGSGNAVAMQNGPGPARCVATFANRLILGNVFDTGTGAIRGLRVSWSADGDGDTWSGATSGSADLIETPDSITRLLMLRDRLIIYKSQSLFTAVETGLSTIPISFALASRNVGAVAGGSVASAIDRHFFMGEENIYEFDGASPPRPIGIPVRSVIRNTNPAALRQVFSFIDLANTEYWLFLPVGQDTYAKTALVYNWIDQTWSPWDFGGKQLTAGSRAASGSAKLWSDYNPATGPAWSDLSAVSWASLLTSGSPTYLVGNSDGTTDEVTGSSLSDYTNTAIDAFWESPDIDFSGEAGGMRPLLTSDLKSLRRVEVRLRGPAGNSVLDGYVSTDGGNSFTNMTRTTSSASDVLNFFTWTTGARFRVRLRNMSVSQDIPGVQELVLHCHPASIR